MIVTSKRCFLNVLTQLMDKSTLLNANYYMADMSSPDGNARLTDQLQYNEFGQLVNVVDDASASPVNTGLGLFHIKYGTRDLDPSIYATSVMVSGGNPVDMVSAFVSHLKQSQTMVSIFQFLFKDRLQGNGLQILVINDDEVAINYGGIICEYLSQNFGVDITFIDPQYRPNVQGRVEYVGDKQRAEIIIKDIRDAELLLEFNQHLSTSGGLSECVNNLTVWLDVMDFYQLVYLYNLLFPQSPLPPDNYTTEHIKQIIIGKVTAGIPNSSPYPNLYTSDEYFDMLKEYEDQPYSYEDAVCDIR